MCLQHRVLEDGGLRREISVDRPEIVTRGLKVQDAIPAEIAAVVKGEAEETERRIKPVLQVINQ